MQCIGYILHLQGPRDIDSSVSDPDTKEIIIAFQCIKIEFAQNGLVEVTSESVYFSYVLEPKAPLSL